MSRSYRHSMWLSKFTRLDEYDEPDSKHTQKYYKQAANRIERHVENCEVKQWNYKRQQKS